MNENQIRDFMTQEARKTNGASIGIPARLMDFPLPEGSPAYAFFGGNALASSLFAVFSAIFPPGERFFVESAAGLHQFHGALHRTLGRAMADP
ncbi:MAG: hypothetical protein Q7T36_10795 [Fluviicoccus sp.]|uniref:hypothetical protein n=1 Tax=Fluviicoccus sp. TaxID=2003552 RepID=UPI0027165FFA|nr:hypothetical protein [Fluviicoccus sp.]MDO8330943.1 hypothetical protein [Fluviicoccus sp.]